MRCVVLVGTEFEENLSLRYLSSSLAEDGFQSALISFNDPSCIASVVEEILALSPLVVGLSLPFQLRAGEFLNIARELRRGGCSAHITIGGHFATFEYGNILRDYPEIDSVVRHEGELTLRELCCRLRDGRSLDDLAGAVVRTPGGVVDFGKRRIPPLDDLPFPDRRGPARVVMGVPIAPILGSRGCYADCSFCCIYAYAENADGARYRRRTPEHIAEEMAREYFGRGVRLFVFHDDNFFVPSREQNIARYQRLKNLLEDKGVRDYALVVKCRPNDVHRDLFTLLKSMGLIRVYVGIETNSDEGIVSLNRRITTADNRRALEVFDELDLYHTFNVLIFDPEATPRGVERNLDFMEDYAAVPFNFCRAEVYAGTPLKQILAEQGRLEGDYMAWGYEMRDPVVEVLFRIASTAFFARNFKPDGMANLNMGIRMDSEIMRCFHPACWDGAWQQSVVDFSRRIGLNTVALMREALAFVRESDVYDHAGVKTFTRELARRVARADLHFVAECKAFRREIERRVLERSGVHAEQEGACATPWAAETARLGGSTGLEVSTERLPIPVPLACSARPS